MIFLPEWLDTSEMFQAVLTVGVDVPMEERALLSQVQLKVNAGMYKLHVDKEVGYFFQFDH